MGPIWQNNFTNSSQKGLLYVQVVYKYIVIYKLNLQVNLSVLISVLLSYSNFNSKIKGLDSSFQASQTMYKSLYFRLICFVVASIQ